MTKPTAFEIKVPSEDPKKKEDKPENDKPDFDGSSKLLKDVKKDDIVEGEELVSAFSNCTVY